MSVICNIHFSSREFDYDAAAREFSVDASVLSKGGKLPIECPVYDDACDLGFIMVSAKTGRELLFVHYGDQRAPEGDLVFSDFRSSNPELRVLVWND